MQASFLTDYQLLNVLKETNFPGTDQIPPNLLEGGHLISPDKIAKDPDLFDAYRDWVDSTDGSTDPRPGQHDRERRDRLSRRVPPGPEQGQGPVRWTRFASCDSALSARCSSPSSLLVSGCASGGDDPSTTQAAKDVSAWMDELGTTLAQGVEPLRAWQATDDGSKDRKSGCEDGRARKDVRHHAGRPGQQGPPDAALAGHASRGSSRLRPAGTVPKNTGTSGKLSATRMKEGPRAAPS